MMTRRQAAELFKRVDRSYRFIVFLFVAVALFALLPYVVARQMGWNVFVAAAIGGAGLALSIHLAKWWLRVANREPK